MVVGHRMQDEEQHQLRGDQALRTKDLLRALTLML